MTEEQKAMQEQVKMMADSFLYVNRQPMVKTPADYDLEYEDLKIVTEDNVEISAWFIKGTKDKTIILAHPGAFSKYGYSIANEGNAKSGYNQDVEFIPVAKHLVNEGYNVIMYDQRNHGESGLSPEGGIHNPYKAHLDNIAILDYVSNHEDLKNNKTGLLSFCQSSYKSMVGMSNRPEVYEKANVKAFVAIQPIGFREFYKGYQIPEPVIEALAEVYKEKGVDMDQQNPVLFAQNVKYPTLFVQNINDPWSDMEHSKEIYDKIPSDKEAIWLDEEEHHRFLTYNWFSNNPEQLIAFFDKYIK